MKYVIVLFSVGIMLMSCNNKAAREAELKIAKQHVVDSMRAVAAKKHTIDSMRLVEAHHAEINNQPVETTRKKKGWSGTAKGAVIGAGTGAVAGAVIDKKHGEGAVVGGLIGAGVGAATGAVIDSKHKKKKKTTTQ
jgi:YMGG-like Gly-zipper